MIAAAIPARPRHHLLKILGITFGVAVAIGQIIGSGILRAPSEIAREVPGVALIVGLWVLGAIQVSLAANIGAELGAAIPRTGGGYNYARRALGFRSETLLIRRNAHVTDREEGTTGTGAARRVRHGSHGNMMNC